MALATSRLPQNESILKQAAEAPSVAIVVATYNERENLEPLLVEFFNLPKQYDILIIDDNSPDGTGILADTLADSHPRLHVIHRAKKEGLSRALIQAFNWALDARFDLIVNLDADLSHDPREIAGMIEQARSASLNYGRGADLVIGSRYSGGVRVINWPMQRLLLSLFAACYVRNITGMAFGDPTSGFRCFRSDALREALQDPLVSRGYSFHVEVLHRFWRRGMVITEAPIVYRDRRSGETKMSARIVLEALWIPFLLLSQHKFRRSPSSPSIESSKRPGRLQNFPEMKR